MDKNHAHPLDAGEIIFGTLLRVGEKMQAGDRYDSLSGKWVPVPSVFFGHAILPSDGMRIRPASQTQPAGGANNDGSEHSA